MWTLAFVASFLLAAALIAAWVDGRSNYQPQSSALTIHFIVAFAATKFFGPWADDQLVGSGLPFGQLISVIGVQLPLVVYCLVVALWMLRLLVRTLARP